MHQIQSSQKKSAARTEDAWRNFASLFAWIFGGVVVGIYAFILLVDPYDVVPFSLPMERRIVSISQRYMYPQIIRSGKFDAVVIGSSTSRLIDPEILNPAFGLRFANLSMDSMSAWEQQKVISLFEREVGRPKALIIGLDSVWCHQVADRAHTTRTGFPDWLYDDSGWNDLLYLLNSATLEIAGRMAGYKLGLYRERIRYDGFGVFVPPEEQYDLERARGHIWGSGPRERQPQISAVELTRAERDALAFPALDWLDGILARLPASSEKILSFMPVHVAAQPLPGGRAAALEAECKARVTAIAEARGAILADWRIKSPITAQDSNYWDNLHYRLPIAERIGHALAGPIRAGEEAQDGAWRILVRLPAVGNPEGTAAKP